MRSRANSAALVSAGAGSIEPGRACPVLATIGCSSMMLWRPRLRLIPPWIVRQVSPRVQATAPRTYRQTASCQLIQSRMRPVESRDRTRVPWMSPEVLTSASMGPPFSFETGGAANLPPRRRAAAQPRPKGVAGKTWGDGSWEGLQSRSPLRYSVGTEVPPARIEGARSTEQRVRQGGQVRRSASHRRRMHLDTRQDARVVEARRVPLGLLEIVRMAGTIGRGDAARPAPGACDVAGIEEVVVGRGAHLLGIRHRALAELQREFAPFLRRRAERADEFGECRVAGVRLAESADLAEEVLEPDALQLHDLATEQVDRLDLGGALVQGRDARIARQLLHAVLGDVAVATEYLQCVVGAFDARFGQQALHDRGEERDQCLGAFAFRIVIGVPGDVFLRVGIQPEQTAAFGERLLRQQHASHVGM